MRQLKILALGTADYLRTHGLPLQQDCERLGYDFEKITIDDQKDISNINHRILEEMVDYISKKEFQRLCFMDPECRIIAPVPNEWIESERPVVFFKVRNKDGTTDPKFTYRSKHGNGERLPCRIIGQPMFVSKQDVDWFKMTLDLSKAASDIGNNQYTRNEMFIETALEYNNIDYKKEYIIYSRHADLKHSVVKGTWETSDTVIKHPDIYGLFDTKTIAGNPVFGDNPILDQQLLERHTKNLETFENINKHMWLEKTADWQDFDEWSVNPALGQIKLRGFDGVKYHHTILEKIEKNLVTPAVIQFRNYNLDK